jgi:hypothetical protein
MWKLPSTFLKIAALIFCFGACLTSNKAYYRSYQWPRKSSAISSLFLYMSHHASIFNGFSIFLLTIFKIST